VVADLLCVAVADLLCGCRWLSHAAVSGCHVLWSLIVACLQFLVAALLVAFIDMVVIIGCFCLLQLCSHGWLLWLHRYFPRCVVVFFVIASLFCMVALFPTAALFPVVASSLLLQSLCCAVVAVVVVAPTWLHCCFPQLLLCCYYHCCLLYIYKTKIC